MRVACVVIGAGPAGCSAAVQCKRLGLEPVLLDQEGRAGGLVRRAYCVENYPGLEGPLPGPALAGRLQEHLQRFQLPVTQGVVERVEPADDDTWRVIAGPEQWRAESVVMCTGTVARRLALPGTHADIACHDDVADVLSAGFRRVAIVGGGEAAYDYALSLARAGVRVSILVRGGPNVRGRLPTLVAASSQVEVFAHTRLLRAQHSGAGLEIAIAGPGAARAPLHVDALLSAIGRIPTHTALLPDRLEPSLDVLEPTPGLFVCGDARHGGLGQVGIAVGDGLAAAMRVVRRHEALRAHRQG